MIMAESVEHTHTIETQEAEFAMIDTKRARKRKTLCVCSVCVCLVIEPTIYVNFAPKVSVIVSSAHAQTDCLLLCPIIKVLAKQKQERDRKRVKERERKREKVAPAVST